MPESGDGQGSTPVADISGLIPAHIRLKSELDEWEAENILLAVRKYLYKKKTFRFDETSIKKLHKDMFGATWKWAGQFRKAELNMGAPPAMIAVEIKKLVDDAEYWEESKAFGVLTRSVMIHHRLVKVHAFLNGNGRHARLLSDIILHNAGHAMPSWPNAEMVEKTEVREKYIRALKKADSGDYGPLTGFTKGLIG